MTNNEINRLHARCLRVIYNDKTSSFVVDFLAKDGSVTIHTRSLQILDTDMFKVHKDMSAELRTNSGTFLCQTKSL